MAPKRGALPYRLHKVCVCGKKFSTNRSNKRHCSQPCQYREWAAKNPRMSKKQLDALVAAEVAKAKGNAS